MAHFCNYPFHISIQIRVGIVAVAVAVRAIATAVAAAAATSTKDHQQHCQYRQLPHNKAILKLRQVSN